ncbi:MAG: aminodeoxychorismate/anthranilate synthase component II [Planctomycetota bacterium]
MILVIDNYDSFTWNLVQRLGEIDPSLDLGRDLLVVRNDKLTPDEAEALNDGTGPDRVLISPGPCTPAESGNSREIIRRFEGRVPILGVCLGHQCMADNSGMKVIEHRPIHGKPCEVEHDGEGVFAGLSQPFTATRYHSLIVDSGTIPELTPGQDGWEVSAWSTEADGYRVVMGLRRVWADPSKAPIEGVQFHPESFMTTEGPKLLENFLRTPARSAVG